MLTHIHMYIFYMYSIHSIYAIYTVYVVYIPRASIQRAQALPRMPARNSRMLAYSDFIELECRCISQS